MTWLARSSSAPLCRNLGNNRSGLNKSQDASLGTQIYSIIVVGLFVVVTTSIVWMVVKAISGIRVSSDDELQGLDTSELGMEAYPEFAQTN